MLAEVLPNTFSSPTSPGSIAAQCLDTTFTAARREWSDDTACPVSIKLPVLGASEPRLWNGLFFWRAIDIPTDARARDFDGWVRSRSPTRCCLTRNIGVRLRRENWSSHGQSEDIRSIRYLEAAAGVFCAQSGSPWHGITAIAARFSDG